MPYDATAHVQSYLGGRRYKPKSKRSKKHGKKTRVKLTLKKNI